VTVTVTDAAGALATSSYELTVNDINDAPLAVGIMTGMTMTDGDNQSDYPIDPTNFFSDVDGDILTYTVTTSDPDGANSSTETLDEWNTSTWVIGEAGSEAGDKLVVITASDGQATATQSFTMTINAAAASFSMDDQLIQIRNMDTITKAQVSIDEWGADYTVGNTDTLIKFEVWIDAGALSTLSATEILGYQFDMDFDASQVGELDFSTIGVAGDNFGFNGNTSFNTDNSAITFNKVDGGVAIASSVAIVDTDVSNDGPPSFLGVEKLIGTFYVNTIDPNAISADITINTMLVVTDAGNIVQDDYTYSLDIA